MFEESLEMLKSAEGQNNAVFACFGAAAQQSQFFEAALGEFILVYNKICKTSLTVPDIESMHESLQRKTMGGLLSQFRQIVKMNDSNFENRMDEALKQRNFLMHHFFRERTELLVTEEGRMSMLHELVGIANLLESVTILTVAARIAMCRRLRNVENL